MVFNLMNEASQIPTIFSTMKERKIAAFLLAGFVLHILSLFSPLSNKVVNNIFYIGVMLPALLMTRRFDIKALWSSQLVKAAIVYGAFTSLMMAITLDGYKIKYVTYFFAFLLAFYHLDKNKLFNPAVVAYSLCILVLTYSLMQLFIFYEINGAPLTARPWFSGWQLFTPSYFTAYISVACLASAYYLFVRRSYLLFLILFSLVIALFVITQTRMGLVGVLLSAPFFVWLAVKQRVLSFSAKSILVVFIGVALIAALYQAGLFDVLTARGESYRVLIATTAWTEGLNCNVLFGCGYAYDFALDIGRRILITEHSSYSNQVLRSGLVGVFLLLIVIIFTVFSGFRTKTPWVLSFIAGCGCLLVEGQSLMAQPRAFTQLIFWFPFCMVVLADLEYKRKNELVHNPEETPVQS